MSEVKQCPFCGEKPTVVVDNKLEDALLARAEKAEATIQNKQVVLDAYRQEVTELQDALDISAQVTAKQIAKSAADLQRAEKAEAIINGMFPMWIAAMSYCEHYRAADMDRMRNYYNGRDNPLTQDDLHALFEIYKPRNGE